jgi:hypothetical protein
VSNALTTTGSFSLSPQSLDEALRFADMLAASDMIPKEFQRKPGNILVAMQWGAEVGLKPLQALQNIAVINGRPSLWGDAVIALARNSPACEYVLEEEDGDTAICRVKRRGEPEQVRTFSFADAKTAGLAGKAGPWTQYPKRMRQMRARAFALRDVFPDVLKGLPVAEELMDMPTDPAPRAPAAPKHMGAVEQVKPTTPEPNENLVNAAQDASLQGIKAYAAWFATINKDERKQLDAAGHHKACKRAAEEVDAAAALVPEADPRAVMYKAAPAVADEVAP